MSVHELIPEPADAVPGFALTRLQQWCSERPLELALRHRRLGVWQLWRWIDVRREVERYADGLRQQGFGPGSRLLLSGAFEPTLLLLALAARSLGGVSGSVSRASRGEALRRQLTRLRPDFAFVQGRENLSAWLHSGVAGDWPLLLLSPQAVPHELGAWRVGTLAVLAGGERPQQQRSVWREAFQPLLWNDEGTEWDAGLSSLLARWLDSGEGLAFPETSACATRDRSELAPGVLLLSPARVQELAAEIEARLAPPDSWRRRLCDWTLSDPHSGLRRWIKARVRRLLGFANLRGIEVLAARDSVAGADLARLRDYLERAA